jgi:phage gpG-like protein
MISDEMLRKFDEVVKKIKERADDIAPAIRIIAGLAEETILQNIASGGRYDGSSGSSVTIFSGGNVKWKPLAESTKKAYKAKGWSPLTPTLNRSKNLLSRLEVSPFRSSAFVISANSPYAAIHQHGGTIHHPGGTEYGYKTKADASQGKIKFLKTGTGYMVLGKTKPHKIKIPARPYMVFKEKDIEEWINIIADIVLKN